eukprot:341399-Chlamydomonas_euryale.AAC.3
MTSFKVPSLGPFQLPKRLLITQFQRDCHFASSCSLAPLNLWPRRCQYSHTTRLTPASLHRLASCPCPCHAKAHRCANKQCVPHGPSEHCRRTALLRPACRVQPAASCLPRPACRVQPAASSLPRLACRIQPAASSLPRPACRVPSASLASFLPPSTAL